ncbi:unnamed protein product [Schistocephalus solidus]|uniref:SANT domain-containing protein n=1 Tax=Schistocephalus solidus TaxID=70667 RepID=A0A183SVG4_SCHSO|nr:unnamed protein product [Schistocephalus solidus]
MSNWTSRPVRKKKVRYRTIELGQRESFACCQLCTSLTITTKPRGCKVKLRVQQIMLDVRKHSSSVRLMANAQKVANIFELASLAFGKLAELTLDLKIYQTQSSSSRWTIAEVEQLKDAISRFGADLSKIAEVLDTKTVTQIKHKIRNKADPYALSSGDPTRIYSCCILIFFTIFFSSRTIKVEESRPFRREMRRQNP